MHPVKQGALPFNSEIGSALTGEFNFKVHHQELEIGHLNARERMSIFYLHQWGLSLRDIGRSNKIYRNANNAYGTK